MKRILLIVMILAVASTGYAGQYCKGTVCYNDTGDALKNSKALAKGYIYVPTPTPTLQQAKDAKYIELEQAYQSQTSNASTFTSSATGEPVNYLINSPIMILYLATIQSSKDAKLPYVSADGKIKRDKLVTKAQIETIRDEYLAAVNMLAGKYTALTNQVDACVDNACVNGIVW